jgi:levanbiose-producing levanase
MAAGVLRTSFAFSGAPVGPSREQIVVLALERGRPRLLEIVVDRGSVEAFANGGRIAFTDLKFPPRDADRVAVFAQRGRATLSGLTVAQLRADDDTTDDTTDDRAPR